MDRRRALMAAGWSVKTDAEDGGEITFTILNIEFKAKSGMMWLQFIVSSYNLETPENNYSSFYAFDGFVNCSFSFIGNCRVLLNGQYVSLSDYIVPDAQYNIKAPDGYD